jgi:hypothetical protein
MHGSMMKNLFLAMTLLVATAMPATAQTLGVGVSFLGDDGGTGVTLDYSKPFRTLTGDRTLGWVGDFSFHTNGFGNDLLGVDVSLRTLMFQGGLRLRGNLNERVAWHVQGLAGIVRQSFSADATGINEDLCDLLELDCGFGDSETSFLITPGAGIDYNFGERAGLRAQLDFPIAFVDEGGSTTRFWFGLAWRVGQ